MKMSVSPLKILEIFCLFLFKSGIGGGVPKVFNLEKKTRQSTDLEEYDFKVPKNFI